MTLSAWLSLAAICTMGAISPGPSLALVMRNTLAVSRAHGVLTALAHGVGVGLYAFLTAVGLAVLVARSEILFAVVRYGGAGMLFYLGLLALLRGSGSAGSLNHGQQAAVGSRVHALRDGFLIAFLNPKIALFFIALFSQFVGAQALLAEKMLMALLAALIDMCWYVLVAFSLSQPAVREKLRGRMQTLDRVFGVVLIGLAVRVLLL